MDLGSSARRWANLFVGDLVLSNEGSGGNEIDGTEGNWIVQEGEENLYLLNKKNGKKYKFKLCLVSPEIQGYDEMETINLKKFLKQKNIIFDAVCTSFINLWEDQ